MAAISTVSLEVRLEPKNKLRVHAATGLHSKDTQRNTKASVEYPSVAVVSHLALVGFVSSVPSANRGTSNVASSDRSRDGEVKICLLAIHINNEDISTVIIATSDSSRRRDTISIQKVGLLGEYDSSVAAMLGSLESRKDSSQDIKVSLGHPATNSILLGTAATAHVRMIPKIVGYVRVGVMRQV